MTPQFVEVRFRPTDQRSYCYRNDGEPVAVGDMVLVASRGREAAVEVVAIVGPPTFPTKAIIGKAPVSEAAESFRWIWREDGVTYEYEEAATFDEAKTKAAADPNHPYEGKTDQ